MADSIRIEGENGEVEFKAFEGEHASPAIGESEIRAFEAQFDVTLPGDYRKYMLRLNGGEVFPRGVRYEYAPSDKIVLERFLDPWDEIITDCIALVQVFYAIGHRDENLDLARAQTDVRRWARAGLLGIASTSTGDFIVLDLAEGVDKGSVKYLTIHGVAALEDDEDEIPLGYIAPDFATFARRLFDEDAEIDRKVEEHLTKFRN